MGVARCSRCHTPATHTARRHGVTVRMCRSHHRHVWEALVRDGWIITELNTPVLAPA